MKKKEHHHNLMNNYLKHLTFAELIGACLYIVSDNVIQKVKCHFNSVSLSQAKAKWAKVEEELKFWPPVQLRLEDAALPNGVTNGGHAGAHVEVGKLLHHLPNLTLQTRKTWNASSSFYTDKYIYIMCMKPKKTTPFLS